MISTSSTSRLLLLSRSKLATIRRLSGSFDVKDLLHNNGTDIGYQPLREPGLMRFNGECFGKRFNDLGFITGNSNINEARKRVQELLKDKKNPEPKEFVEIATIIREYLCKLKVDLVKLRLRFHTNWKFPKI